MPKARRKNSFKEKNVQKTKKRKGEQKKQLSPSPLALKRSLLKKYKRPVLVAHRKIQSKNEIHPLKAFRYEPLGYVRAII